MDREAEPRRRQSDYELAEKVTRVEVRLDGHENRCFELAERNEKSLDVIRADIKEVRSDMKAMAESARSLTNRVTFGLILLLVSWVVGLLSRYALLP